MRETLRVALVQAKPYPELDDPRNIGHAIRLLEQCRGKEVDLVCLPEYFPWAGEEALGDMAKRLRCYIAAGLIEAAGERFYNTATLFDRRGRIVGRQRKFNLGRLEQQSLGLAPSDGTFRILEADFGRVGMPVATDLWGQPEAARTLTDQGADLLVNPSIFPILRGHWKYGLLVRAFDNFVPVVGVNTADFNSKLSGRTYRHHGGHSLIVQPPRLVTRDDFQLWLRSLDSLEGWITLKLDEREQVSVGEVDLGTTRKFRTEFWRQLGFQRRPRE